MTKDCRGGVREPREAFWKRPYLTWVLRVPSSAVKEIKSPQLLTVNHRTISNSVKLNFT